MENFRVDVKKRLGIDYESLKKINPLIIFGSISGFGQEGPYAERPAVDQVIQGMSGLMTVTGEPDRGPMRAGIAVSDTSAGMFLGQGILLALLHREKTGEGQWVHTSLLESMLCKLDFQAARYTMNGEIPMQEGNHHPTLSPMGVFNTRDGQVNLAASTNKMWAAFCEATGAITLAANKNYATVEGRLKTRLVLWQEVNEITTQFFTDELVEKMNSVGIPCGPINNVGEAFNDHHVSSLCMTKKATHSELGELDLLRSPINLSRFEHGEAFDKAGPELGAHSDEILREMDYNEEFIDELKTNGVVKAI